MQRELCDLDKLQNILNKLDYNFDIAAYFCTSNTVKYDLKITLKWCHGVILIEKSLFFL